MEILGVHHAQLTIPPGSEAKARDFYCGFLKIRELAKPENLKKRGGLWLDLGVIQVHVGTEEGGDRRRTKVHIAYRVSGLEEWRNKLQQEGIEILEGPPIPGYLRFEFRDPFGNRVEMIEAQK